MPARPFQTFNFHVNLQIEGDATWICDAEFSECDGLEMTQEPKTIREGGGNGRQIHLTGPITYGQLSLKRGMTGDYGLWEWFERTHRERSLRASGNILIISSDREREEARFALTGCLPIKLKAPALNAKDGEIAIEELTVAYETLRRVTA